MLRRVRIGTSQADAPIRELRVRRPHLLAVQHPPSIGAGGGRRHRRQVAARPGLAEELAPQVVGREDGCQPALFLLLGAMGEQCGTGEIDADASDQLGCPCARQLFLDDVVLGRSRPPATVFLGPRDTDPTARGELGLPRAEERDLFVEFGESGRQADAVLPGQVGAQPLTQLATEGVLCRCRRQVHLRQS